METKLKQPAVPDVSAWINKGYDKWLHDETVWHTFIKSVSPLQLLWETLERKVSAQARMLITEPANIDDLLMRPPMP